MFEWQVLPFQLYDAFQKPIQLLVWLELPSQLVEISGSIGMTFSANMPIFISIYCTLLVNEIMERSYGGSFLFLNKIKKPIP